MVFLFLLISCSQQEVIKEQQYEDHIGDTPYNAQLDNPNFRFCDSNAVVHSRNLVKYKGGWKALQIDISEKYNFQPTYSSFTGYFIIRFAVNCGNETGKFRVQIVDNNFSEILPPKGLKEHLLSIVKKLNKWEHAVYNNKDYDCYTFINIKFENGKIKEI